MFKILELSFQQGRQQKNSVKKSTSNIPSRCIIEVPSLIGIISMLVLANHLKPLKRERESESESESEREREREREKYL